jgi:excisionase family DNA binding protein
MQTYSTRQAAKKLGLGSSTLARYVAEGKVPAPRPVDVGGLHVRAWTAADIERVRKLLPSIPDRRTREHRKRRKK